MDLNDARIFAQVAEHGTLSRVAEAEGVPASTVSRRISRLEQDLGVRLITRTTRQLTLTDAGRAFLKETRSALEAFRVAEEEAKALGSEPSGRVRITAPVTLIRLLWPAVSEFLSSHPKVKLEIDATDETTDLIAGGFDLALRAGPLADSSFTVRELVDTTRRLYATPEFIAQRGMPQSARDLANFPCVLWRSRGTQQVWDLVENGASIRISVQGRVVASEMGLVLQATLAGHGIGMLPSLMASHAVQSGLLRRVIDGVEGEPGRVYLVSPPGQLRLPAVRALSDQLRAQARRLLEVPSLCSKP